MYDILVDLQSQTYQICNFLLYFYFTSQIIQTIFLIIAVSMHELINDPDSINFFSERKVSLPLLKHQIDRRILKITAIIQRKQIRPNPHNLAKLSVLHKSIQTESTPDLNFLVNSQTEENRVLCPSKKMYQNQIQTNCSSIKLKHNKQKHESIVKNEKRKLLLTRIQRNNGQKYNCYQNQNSLPIVQSTGFTFRGTVSTNRNRIRQSQNDRIFQQIDFVSRFSSAKASNVFAHGKPNHKTAPSVDSPQQRDFAPIGNNTDFSAGEMDRSDISHPRKLTRKNKYQELPIPVSERRLIVSSECFERMRVEANELIGRRRKELADNKLRSNVLNKIQERYGQLDQN